MLHRNRESVTRELALLGAIGLSQQTRHAQAPIVKAQIAALEYAARETSIRAASAPELDQIGHVLTSNMSAGFALELGLKLFYMTFAPKGPPPTHSLSDLYAGCPRQVCGDIDETYRSNLPTTSIRMYGLRTSPTRPAAPTATAGSSCENAFSFFDSTDLIFVQARYFFEKVDDVDWSIIDHPIDHMLQMSNVLRVVYDAYGEHGGWSGDHFRS